MFCSVTLVLPSTRGEANVSILASGILPIEVPPLLRFLVMTSFTSTSRTQRNRVVSFSKPYWKAAADLVPKHSHLDGDYLVVPRLEGNSSVLNLDLRPFTPKVRLHTVEGMRIPLTFPLRKSTAWLLGLYVAEGFSTSVGARLSLGMKETELQEQAFTVIRSLGYKPGLQILGSTRVVKIQSRILSRAMSAWCGRGAPNKRVPEFIFSHSDLSIAKAFLEGYMAGDGYRTEERVSASTASKTLALQIQLLYSRLGVFVHLWQARRRRKGVIQGRVVTLHTVYRMGYNLPVIARSRARVLQESIVTPVLRLSARRTKRRKDDSKTIERTGLLNNVIVFT